MKIQLDPNQQFQLDAVAAVTDLFDGQPKGAPEYSVIFVKDWGGMFSGQTRTELGVGNHLLLAGEKLLANTRAVQVRNDIEVVDPAVELEPWELFDTAANEARLCPHFSVEMETGTGKTYVYLRTVFELSRRYGFQKFIIVVPSVAIREGVLKNIEITRDHFRALYNNIPFEHFVYDARKVNRLRQFAVSSRLQILVINIDAFRKNFTGTEEEQKSNVIYKESDRLSGRQPIEFVRAARPIVIIDEPQSVDSTGKAQEAIKALNPLCTLRYSATHRNPYNLVYRLDPVRAFELKLVKQIVVASPTTDGSMNDAFVRVDQIDYKKGIKARLRMHVQTAQGPREKSVTVKNELPEEHRDLMPAVIDLLATYQIERHIRRDRDEGPNRLRKKVQLSPEFEALWDRIKPKTTYRVEFETDDLVRRAVDALQRMEKIEAPKIRVSAGQIGLTRGGVSTTALSVAEEQATYGDRSVPDLLAYLQNETELTRSTLVRILEDSGRLGELFNNPQRFMDAVAGILEHELHRLLVDGIKYERIEGSGPEAEWEMLLFKNEELINYLTALQVGKSIYEYVICDSEVEREFARRLDEREDIKLFVKLPGWFEIETPVGKYNPDWAILKHDDQALYLVRETKGTRDFLKLRTTEADKVRCGRKHFDVLDVPFAVVVTADEV